jgi:hypothetical protein
MKAFPDTWYITVPVVRTGSSLFWTNDEFLSQLAGLHEELSSEKAPSSTDKLELGLVTSLPTRPFYTCEEWDTFTKSIRVLKTDRFFNPYSPDVGSGRNVILKHACWKGVGKNFASTRMDYRHTSGMMAPQEVITEVIFDYVMKIMASSLRVPIWAAGLYVDYPGAFIIRSSEIIRCAQVPGRLEDPERKICKEYLQVSLPGISESDWFMFIIERLAGFLAKGIFHTSATADNLTLDGRLVDNQSIEWIQSRQSPFLLCEVFFKNANRQLGEAFAERAFEKIRPENISNISSQCIFLHHSHYALKCAFKAIGLNTIEWEDLVPGLAKQLQLPSLFFSLDKDLVPQKLDYLIAHIREVGSDQVEYLNIEDRKILINSGKRMNKEIFKSADRLVQVAGAGAETKDFKNIVDLLLNKYALN